MAMSDPTLGLSSEVDHFVEQWFGEPRQEVRAMIYRWLGIAWDDAMTSGLSHGYAEACYDHSIYSDGDPGGEPQNPYTANPMVLPDWTPEQIEVVAAACAVPARGPDGRPVAKP